MVHSEIAARYSKALFQLESSLEEQENRLALLKGFADDFSKNNEIRNFFLSPQIPLEEKNRVIENGLKKTEDQLVIKFLKFLLLKGHLKLIPLITKEYEQEILEKKGILEGKLRTSIPIEKTVKEHLLKSLEKLFRKKIELKEIVDPSLIGGGVVSVNNQLLDFSLKGKLDKLKEDLLSVNVYRK